MQGIKVNPQANTFICVSVTIELSVREEILSKRPSNANRSADAKATSAGRRTPEPPLENAPPEIITIAPPAVDSDAPATIRAPSGSPRTIVASATEPITWSMLIAVASRTGILAEA
jgi:hypothetical protein